MLIGATQAGMGGLDVDLVMLQGASGFIGDDLAIVGATENLKSDAHCVEDWQIVDTKRKVRPLMQD